MKTKNGLKKKVMVKDNNMTYSELLKVFLKNCEIINLSQYTIDFYVVANRTLNKFVKIDELRVSDINQTLIEDYILHLKAKGLKAITINTYLRGVKSVLKHGMNLGYIKRFVIHDMKTSQEIKQIYTKEELALLLKKPDMSSFAEYRNWVIINFLLGTAVRALELRSIKVEDIDLSSSMLIVKRTKNKKQRYVPISKTLNKILNEYLEYRDASDNSDYLFCNEFSQMLPRTTLQMAITKYSKKRGVYRYSLHLYRHTFATMWILNGGDIFTLQKILGHSSLKMVNVYLNLYAEDLQRNYDSFCALESVSESKERITM